MFALIALVKSAKDKVVKFMQDKVNAKEQLLIAYPRQVILLDAHHRSNSIVSTQMRIDLKNTNT